MRRNIGGTLAALAIALGSVSCAGGGSAPDPSVFGSRRPLTQAEKDLVKPPATTSAAPQSSSAQTGGSVTEKATTYFVGFDSFSTTDLTMLKGFAKKLGVTVEILPRTPLSESFFDGSQVIGERMIAALAERFANLLMAPSSTVIGFTEQSMRLESYPEWAWAFGQRSGDLGVISSNMMEFGTQAGSSLYHARLRKMTGRYLGLLSLGLQSSSDPKSMLYTDLLGVDDLDRMQERF